MDDNFGGGARQAPGTVAPGTLCLVGCAAPPVLEIDEVIAAAQDLGWAVDLVLTPTAAQWLAPRTSVLAQRCGRPPRASAPRPGLGAVAPRPDAVLVVPATANTLNKCAAGISDTLALGVINTAIGRGTPLVAVACVSHDLAHPAFPASLATLRSVGVPVLGADAVERSRPLPWREGLAVVTDLASRASPRPPTQRTDSDRVSIEEVVGP